MSFIYNILIQLVNIALKAISPFNAKIKSGVIGRTNTFNTLQNNLTKTEKTLWFHCASLGEYEQGLPVFKQLRLHYSDYKIVLSFFSPSGYEIRKNTPIADIVVYLPIDTKANAKQFLDIVNPELTVFVKYDIWPNYLNEIKRKNLKAILISASFRKNQSYFKFYGENLRKALFSFDHIFTQNQTSKALLESINYNSVSVSGDTRFDRVYSQLELDNKLDFIETFKDNKICIIAGSTWPEGEKLLTNYINSRDLKNVKYIIAPHNIKSGQIKHLQQNLKTKTVLYSEKDTTNLKHANVFIVNTIGLLAKIYSYGNIAYVGGAVGTTGLHNTLEPAVFGIPIIIGGNHKKFPEAQALINEKGLFSVENQEEFNEILDKLIENTAFRNQSGKNNALYIKKNKGAVIHILDYLRIYNESDSKNEKISKNLTF